MRLTTILLTLLLSAGITLAQDYKQLYSEGNAAYKQRNFEEAVTKLTAAAEAAQKTGDKFTALNLAARSARLIKGRENEGIELYNKILQLPDLTDVQYGTAKVAIGSAHYDAKRYDEAMAALDAALQDKRVVGAERETAQLYLGHTEVQRKNLEAAAEQYGKLLTDQTSPTNRVNAHLGLANALERQKRLEDANATLKKAMEVAQGNPNLIARVALDLGGSYRRLKQYAEARAAYELVLNNPSASPAANAIARTRIAATYLDEGNTDEARTRLKAVIDDANAPEAQKKEAQTYLDRIK
jgi:tetratricopeptide (TPR) repeat protein